jgi:hypothetical protein
MRALLRAIRSLLLVFVMLVLLTAPIMLSALGMVKG